MTDQAKKVAVLIAKAIYQTVLETGKDGAPSGPVFAAMQTHGMSYDQYIGLIGGLKKVGAIREENNVLYANKEVGERLGLVG